MSPPGHPWVSTKNFRPIGPAVWPAIGNIYTNVLFYYLDCQISLPVYDLMYSIKCTQFNMVEGENIFFRKNHKIELLFRLSKKKLIEELHLRYNAWIFVQGLILRVKLASRKKSQDLPVLHQRFKFNPVILGNTNHISR